MGQFCGTIPSKLIKELIEAARERRRRRQRGFISWRSLCIARKSVKEVEKNGCMRRSRGKCKQQSQSADINISPLGQLKSSCASTEVPTTQADAKLRFPVDDLTEPVNSCELHIPEGTGTKKVAVGVVNAINRMRTPRIHGQPDMLVSRWIGWREVVPACLSKLKGGMGRRL